MSAFSCFKATTFTIVERDIKRQAWNDFSNRLSDQIYEQHGGLRGTSKRKREREKERERRVPFTLMHH